MTIRQSAIICAFALSFVATPILATPCLAGPCAADLERVSTLANARLDAIAAAGPTTQQSVGAQLHRQPTPGSVAGVEQKLGELSPEQVKNIKDAMTRARKADADGDLAACRSALAEVERALAK